MNIAFWKLWKFVQEYYEGFYGRPKFSFNFEKQHRGSGIPKDIVEDDKMINQQMNLKFTTTLVPFEKSFDVLKMI